jgi:hypothetical protein
LLCTNYLPLNVQEAELFLFADDKILVTQKSENVFKYQVYNIINELQSWFHTDILILNAEKNSSIILCYREEKSAKTLIHI